MKKKSEKSEIEQNICVLLFKMQKGSQMLDTVALWEEATKSQQQKTPCGLMVLRVRGDIGHLKVNTVTQKLRPPRFGELNNNYY